MEREEATPRRQTGSNICERLSFLFRKTTVGRSGAVAKRGRVMGGKGRRRREKNYRAAHGAHSRLPPPPHPSAVDAVPSKLRKIMAFTNSSRPGSAKASVDDEQVKGGGGNGGDKKLHSKDKLDSKYTRIKGDGDNGHSATAKHMDHDDEVLQNSTLEKRRKTKKRKPVDDLRFEKIDEAGIGLKRRERKKRRLEERKRKHKKTRSEENEDFPGHEHVKFGEVVEAPPKLVAVPKALKTTQDASQERLRLKAIEAYRNRKGWSSRPGIDLPPSRLTSPSF